MTGPIAEPVEGFDDHSRLNLGRRILLALARAPAVTGPVDQDDAMRCGEHVAEWLPHRLADWSSRRAAARAAGVAVSRGPDIHHVQNRAGDLDRLSLRREAALEQGNPIRVASASAHQRRDKGIDIIDLSRETGSRAQATRWRATRFRGEKTACFPVIFPGICHTVVVGHFITMVSTFSDRRARINQ